jgi:hypothetical protein
MDPSDFVAPDTPCTLPTLLKVQLDVHRMALSSPESRENETKPHIELHIAHVGYITIPIWLNFTYKPRHHRPAVSTKLIFQFLSGPFPKY